MSSIQIDTKIFELAISLTTSNCPSLPSILEGLFDFVRFIHAGLLDTLE